MTERCQTKFTEKFENQNYVIYVGILVSSFAVLYFYRFHFATIAFSYVLGCLACYYGLNSNILDSLVNKIKCHSVISGAENEAENSADDGCATCGLSDCARHDPEAAAEPWVGLQIHKQLDQAIEDFYNAILNQFITSWYSKITPQPFFIDELRYQLRYASACLLRRAVKINYSRFITERLIPCALRHYTLCADLPDGGPLLASKLAVHPAAANRNAELKYLRSVTNAIMPYLLKNGELQNPVFSVLVREIFAGWVLLSLTDLLAEPYIINALIILAAGDEGMAPLPTTPDYTVEFLSTFARHTDSVYAERARLLRVDVDRVLSEPEWLYALMQHLKSGGRVSVLQFYQDIKLFQTKILNPELSPSEQAKLHKEACKTFARYAAAAEIRRLLDAGGDVRRLQTSPELYQAARETHAELEKVMLPRFLHSEEFYKLLIGSRIPTGYQKPNKKPQHARPTASTLKLDSRLKTALRAQAIDGKVLDCFTNADENEDTVDIDILKYIDTLAAEDVREQDLSTCKVVLTNVDVRLQAPPRRGSVRVFTLAVHRIESGAGARLWSVERSEHDFHLLRSKLLEFHGDTLLSDLPLPSRRDNSPNETLRYKYEDFLQRVLQQSLLQTSELLHLFLTVDGDFSLVVQATTLNANSSDLGNIYQSVTHKLRKEKGQHLESFLRNFLISSDMERYQALKQGTHIEEALEVTVEEEAGAPPRRESRRDLRGTVFGDNFGVEPAAEPRAPGPRDQLAGFTQCFMYFVIKVLKLRGFMLGVVGGALGAARRSLDAAAGAALGAGLARLASPRRLARLVALGHEILFDKRSLPPRTQLAQQRALALSRLLGAAPPAARAVLGAALPAALGSCLRVLQQPQLNKQVGPSTQLAQPALALSRLLGAAPPAARAVLGAALPAALGSCLRVLQQPQLNKQVGPSTQLAQPALALSRLLGAAPPAARAVLGAALPAALGSCLRVLQQPQLNKQVGPSTQLAQPALALSRLLGAAPPAARAVLGAALPAALGSCLRVLQQPQLNKQVGPSTQLAQPALALSRLLGAAPPAARAVLGAALPAALGSCLRVLQQPQLNKQVGPSTQLAQPALALSRLLGAAPPAARAVLGAALPAALGSCLRVLQQPQLNKQVGPSTQLAQPALALSRLLGAAPPAARAVLGAALPAALGSCLRVLQQPQLNKQVGPSTQLAQPALALSRLLGAAPPAARAVLGAALPAALGSCLRVLQQPQLNKQVGPSTQLAQPALALSRLLGAAPPAARAALGSCLRVLQQPQLNKQVGPSTQLAQPALALSRLLGAAPPAARAALGSCLRVLQQPQLNKQVGPSTQLAQPALALSRLLGAAPPAARAALGSCLRVLQQPQLNKQLVYNLLDLCIIELFPELSATQNQSPNEPKS